ncbi:MAG: pyruvate, phosphate dikinase [Solirubrobacterales bacterium]
MSRPSDYVYRFEEGSRDMRELLGGKGANLAEMTNVLGAGRVPPGFTITTAACVDYMRSGAFPDGLDEQVSDAVGWLEETAGMRLGDPGDPLLVSVRSGARVSMPGMLDTVLNLGLNDGSVEGLAERMGARFAWDSYRRLVQMFGDVVHGVDAERFETALREAREAKGVAEDTGLDADDLRALTARFKEMFAEQVGREPAREPGDQLREAIGAVFDSWNGERARDYRRINRIPDEWGTAVNVQQMVFGNRGDDSGSGVAFSRDESTGAPEPSGDFLVNAQGEDVVAGIRNTEDLAWLAEHMPEVHAELIEILARLERHYEDMQDVEFTVEEGRLYVLQTRDAKRPAQAAVRFARDAVAEGLLDRKQALMTIDAGRLEALLHPTFDPEREYEVVARGVAASPGAAKGAIVFSAAEAMQRGGSGEAVILVRPFTEADDVAGFHAAAGILTSEGGKSSHAALVARGMGRPCVAGASSVEIDPERGVMRVDGKELSAGEVIGIDGSTGAVTLDDVPLVHPEIGEDFDEILRWADECRRLGVRANADNPRDAARASSFGAEGIGLCRTEHMFFGEDRDGLVKDMFIAAERWRRARVAARIGDRPADVDVEAERAFHDALARLGELQRADFEGIFRAMAPHPVTIRLLDPPLHEFLPVEHFEAEVERLVDAGRHDDAREARDRLVVAGELKEANPMLGLRGARLGILFWPLYEMQVSAIVEAALAVGEAAKAPEVEIMLPLIAFEGEMEALRSSVVEVVDAIVSESASSIEFAVGTMIEVPRACLIAERLAARADFFSFGTNDLTQMVSGLSRDDAEGSFLPEYLARRLIPATPFETIDEEGVGELVRLAAERGRGANPELRLGICGEHGGDPDSVAFFHSVGLDYVSCSPYRVPIARVAAAQAAIR